MTVCARPPLMAWDAHTFIAPPPTTPVEGTHTGKGVCMKVKVKVKVKKCVCVRFII